MSSSPARRRLAETLRRTLYATLEATWAEGFAVAGRLSTVRGRARGWSGVGGAPVVIVAAHPDDETAGCGGAACLHAEAGDRVGALVVTDGRASRASGLDASTMVARRSGEAHAAARELGLSSLELAGLPEGGWDLADGVAAIRWALAHLHPALVYAPSCVDYHPEHLRVARACAAALVELGGRAPVVRVYEAFVPLGGDLVNCVADISAVARRKRAALACYASQRLGLAQVARRDRYLARLYTRGRAAEAFCELSAAGYASLIGAARWTDVRPPFRGLRGRPVTDPLAYMVGRRARRLLRKACG